MSKCNNCIYSYPQYYNLCPFPNLRMLGGEDCKCYYPRPVQTIQIERCLLCGGVNDQEYKGKQFCSECEKKYCSPKKEEEYLFEIDI